MFPFSEILIAWYDQHKRDLPWRHTKDPYLIWISEIILQQTRVAQGLAYYNRFVHSFPSPSALAAATEDEVLKLWQGLGYYSRARNLHAAAKSMNGVFPSTYEGVLALQGVGPYTAAAICSFAYNMPYAVVDGNVYRVLSRIFGVETCIDSTQGKKEFLALAQKLMDHRRPGLFNQAIMEFGAIQCVPSSPDCSLCPMKAHCVAFKKGWVNRLPQKAAKTQKTERFFNYIYVKQSSGVWMRKRPAGDLWQGLYELPLIETSKVVCSSSILSKRKAYKSLIPSRAKLHFLSGPLKHELSHRTIYACLYRIELEEDFSGPVPEGFCWVEESKISQYPVSQLLHRLLRKTHLL